ncbi:phage baseplate assembly protein V [Marinobacterium sedimentorum]|uniref:phage baseplate assembly protein V n=1 Tax=Marinobacterium sedimentorum TaxID=2927804 RepID=UPI0020C62D02|nr:phage baseplate assembly protein V [Marinobacterium sedimentorum]MCP8687753.1 phage baseplate assembly protein V [Marinobacterium sedimentorum]
MNTADLNRRIESLIRLGTIAQVDHDARTLRVQSGGLLTGWLPWPAEIGRNYRRWRPLRTGTQVIIACPSGDPAQALVIGTLYTDAIASPGSDPDIDLIQFDDGSYIEHNAAANTLNIHCAGAMTLSATHLHIQAPVTQTGGDMTSDGISAQHHTHGGVASGPSSTDEPS